MIEKYNQNMIVRLSSSGLEGIRLEMSGVEVVSSSSYIYKMTLDGYYVRLGLQNIKEMVLLLKRCSNSLNQYIKKANETGSIYAESTKDLQSRFEEIWNVAKEIMARLSTI